MLPSPKVSHGQAGGPLWGLFLGWDICFSECLEEQATDYRPGSIEMVELPQCGGSFSFLFFLSDGKLAAMGYSQYSAWSGGNVFLDPWSGHVNTDCGRNGR